LLRFLLIRHCEVSAHPSEPELLLLMHGMSKNKRIFGAAGGAMGMGALAALLGACCVAPWAVGLVGVAGAVALARLAVLQPYLLVAAGAFLALAFFWAYRPVPNCDDVVCVPESRRRLRWMVWIAAVVVAGLAASALTPSLIFDIP
jgi:hypothetical protein